jgi:hypothetical protein
VDAGSECNDNQIYSNLFERGCFFQHGLTAKTRVCNSDEPHNALERGICRTSEFDYLSVRICSKDWESSVFKGWFLQMVLTELLGAPATMENVSPGSELNFHHPTKIFK